jgi:hypothetical protein
MSCEKLSKEISALENFGRAKLKQAWFDIYNAEAPVSFTPDLLARGIAYRIQEKRLGGLSQSVGHKIALMEERCSYPRQSLRPGNRLIRRWRGATYVVEVTDCGFLFEGSEFASLSEIARTITGTRWSGPRFFGLK